MKYSNLLNWWGFVKCEPKSSQLKEPKTYTTSVWVHFIYLIKEFHNLSWITEINFSTTFKFIEMHLYSAQLYGA